MKDPKFDLTDPQYLRNFLKKYNVWNKKKFGQNFLQDRPALEQIVELGEIKPGETVVEVGPGHGVLSRELLQAGAKVEAIEIDGSILPALKAATREWKENFSVENIHVLDTVIPKGDYKFIANIPYHLTSPILRKFLIESENRPSKMVMLVQKEVGEKICCKEEKNSLLSILVKTFGKPRYARTVPAESFFPPPKVDSAVIVIDSHPKPLISIEPKIYFEMLFSGFKEPRKKFKNIIQKKFFLSNKQVEEMFEKLDIDIDCRSQNITIPQWEEMTKILWADWFEKN